MNGVENLQAKHKLTINFEHVLTGQQVSFPAFLTSFDDSWSSEWESQTVYGRMDDIRTFKRTSRSISLAWMVVAASEAEATHNLEACSRLISMLYPTYAGGSATTISGSPLFKLKFGNLISDPANPGWGSTVTESGLVGTIDGLSYSPDLEGMGFFVVESGLLAKQVNLSCTFTVLHTKPVGWRGKSFRQVGYPYGVGEHGRNDEDLEAEETAAREAAERQEEAIRDAEERAEAKAAKEKEKSDIAKGVGLAGAAMVLGG